MIINENVNNALNSPVRTIDVAVGHLGTSTVGYYFSNDKLKSFSIDRMGDSSKFFGYGVCQKLNVKIIDKDRELEFNAGDTLALFFRTSKEDDFIDEGSFPLFIVTETHRNEITNELSVTAYDALYFLSGITLNDTGIKPPYDIEDLAFEIYMYLRDNTDIAIGNIYLPSDFEDFYIYETGGNFEGTKTIREVLDAIAEATQSIYFANVYNHIEFKRLDIDGEPVYTINKDNYFSLDSGENRRLTKIMHATELGDNISAELPITGSTQYVRNNAFWENRKDIIEIVNNALANVGGLTINQCECDWRGNYLLSIGDKIAIVGKDDSLITTYLLNDTISYDGSLSEHTSWRYEESEAEAADNPTSIGEVVKYTYAKVDKINREIEIVASETEQGAKELAQIKLDTQNIKTKVENTEKEINTITKSVEMAVTADELSIAVQKELENGVDKVTTATGFTFDADGLKVTKSGSEISTQITEDGMSVSNGSNEVLSANNQGVTAIDLHATTFLIIGENSRLENYEGRTGCFWIGGE